MKRATYVTILQNCVQWLCGNKSSPRDLPMLRICNTLDISLKDLGCQPAYLIIAIKSINLAKGRIIIIICHLSATAADL